MTMALVYVAGPYSAEHPHQREMNIHRAWVLGCEVAALGAMPVIPHMNSAHMDGVQDYRFWVEGTLALMRKCDAVILVHGWKESSGTLGEIKEAKRLRMPVFETPRELDRWLHPPSKF